jgi:hypothetical protein
MPKGDGSFEKLNVEDGQKERGSGQKTTFVAKMRKTLAKKKYIMQESGSFKIIYIYNMYNNFNSQ